MPSRDELKRAARRELARRELARREFNPFCRYVQSNYPRAPHLEVMAQHLEAVERYVATQGKEGIGRLMIWMPPRYWKSTTASVLFPAWVLGRQPETRIILTSYNASLAFSFSRRVRNVIVDDPYRRVFGDKAGIPGAISISQDSRSAESWGLAGTMGGMVAAGVGGGISGKGANLLIIDDPHKDRADAESEAARERIFDWYTSTAYMRVENGAIIIIQTRWHTDDLSGKLLKRMADDPGADAWVVLSLPALAVAYPPPALAPPVETGTGQPALLSLRGEGEGVRV